MAYVAVEEAALEQLADALEQLEHVDKALSRAADQLVELGQDLCEDAIARLRERRASEAQIVSYREGWQRRRESFEENVASLREVKRALEASVALVRGIGN